MSDTADTQSEFAERLARAKRWPWIIGAVGLPVAVIAGVLLWLFLPALPVAFAVGIAIGVASLVVGRRLRGRDRTAAFDWANSQPLEIEVDMAGRVSEPRPPVATTTREEGDPYWLGSTVGLNYHLRDEKRETLLPMKATDQLTKDGRTVFRGTIAARAIDVEVVYVTHLYEGTVLLILCDPTGAAE